MISMMSREKKLAASSHEEDCDKFDYLNVVIVRWSSKDRKASIDLHAESIHWDGRLNSLPTDIKDILDIISD